MKMDWLSKVTWENGLAIARLQARQEAVESDLITAREHALALGTQMNTRLSAKTAHLDAIRIHAAEQDALIAANARELTRVLVEMQAIKTKLDTPIKASLSTEGIPWLMILRVVGGVLIVLTAMALRMSPDQLSAAKSLAPFILK